MSAREDAQGLLRHYFQQVYEHAGLNWTSDNHLEINSIVDRIVDAAVEETRAAIARATPPGSTS
jgi:mannitol-1-phosphate/altronate dehydrogenase